MATTEIHTHAVWSDHNLYAWTRQQGGALRCYGAHLPQMCDGASTERKLTMSVPTQTPLAEAGHRTMFPMSVHDRLPVAYRRWGAAGPIPPRLWRGLPLGSLFLFACLSIEVVD